jgi:hypothetical protein
MQGGKVPPTGPSWPAAAVCIHDCTCQLVSRPRPYCLSLSYMRPAPRPCPWGADQWAALPAAVRAEGARVFDLFAVWRMDSGDYAEMVGLLLWCADTLACLFLCFPVCSWPICGP